MSTTDSPDRIIGDLDSLEDEGGTSLGSLYGIPVFSDEMTEQIEEAAAKSKKENMAIKAQLFSQELKKDETYDKIREQVFTVEVVAKEERTFAEEADNTTSIIMIEVMILLCLIVGIFYARKKKKERKQRLENINDFSDF